MTEWLSQAHSLGARKSTLGLVRRAPPQGVTATRSDDKKVNGRPRPTRFGLCVLSDRVPLVQAFRPA